MHKEVIVPAALGAARALAAGKGFGEEVRDTAKSRLATEGGLVGRMLATKLSRVLNVEKTGRNKVRFDEAHVEMDAKGIEYRLSGNGAPTEKQDSDHADDPPSGSSRRSGRTSKNS